MVLVGVYGTLKQGESNYPRYLAPAVPMYDGFYNLAFKMYSNMYYPMIVKDEEINQIYLEIYDLSDEKLRELDGLEEPYNYHRNTVYISEIGEDVEIYVFYGEPNFDTFKLVEDGNFKAERDINDLPKTTM